MRGDGVNSREKGGDGTEWGVGPAVVTATEEQ